MLTQDTSPEFIDSVPDSDPVVQLDSLPAAGLQDASPWSDCPTCRNPVQDGSACPVCAPHVPRSRRPSELTGAAVDPVRGRYVTVSQAARLLTRKGPDGKMVPISPQRVRALISAGWLRAEKINSRMLRIRKSDLRSVWIRLDGRPRK